MILSTNISQQRKSVQCAFNNLHGGKGKSSQKINAGIATLYVNKVPSPEILDTEDALGLHVVTLLRRRGPNLLSHLLLLLVGGISLSLPSPSSCIAHLRQHCTCHIEPFILSLAAQCSLWWILTRVG